MNPDIDDFTTITKALSDCNRVRALFALRNGELCVCQIIELLGLAASTVSKHMSILKHAGLVTSRKEERWMHYRLVKGSDMTKMTQVAFTWIFGALEHDETITSDHGALRKITQQDLTSLCKVQRSR